MLTRNDPTDHAAVAAIDRLENSSNGKAKASASDKAGGSGDQSPMAVKPLVVAAASVAENKYVVLPSMDVPSGSASTGEDDLEPHVPEQDSMTEEEEDARAELL